MKGVVAEEVGMSELRDVPEADQIKVKTAYVGICG